MSSGGHNRVKDYIERVRRIKITDMQKLGTFRTQSHSIYTANWSCRGEPSGSMQFVYVQGDSFITAMYTITDNNTGKKESRADRIDLLHIVTGYGKRSYFKCPDCCERSIVLCYRGYSFKCRKCANLNYYSSQANHDGFTKPDNYIEKICKRLQYKIDNICDIYHVPKPKRMRQYTYERLMRELRHWQSMRNTAFIVGSDKILKKGGWVDGR